MHYFIQNWPQIIVGLSTSMLYHSMFQYLVELVRHAASQSDRRQLLQLICNKKEIRVSYLEAKETRLLFLIKI